jgi:hypothetical protein
MSDGLFKLASGRDVNLDEFHVHESARGYLQGKPNLQDVLRELPAKVSQIFGGDGALWVNEPPPGPLPFYTFYAHFHSSEPLHPEADYSVLIVCWFGKNLPESVRSCVASQLTTLDWDSHAEDAYF